MAFVLHHPTGFGGGAETNHAPPRRGRVPEEEGRVLSWFGSSEENCDVLRPIEVHWKTMAVCLLQLRSVFDQELECVLNPGSGTLPADEKNGLNASMVHLVSGAQIQ